MQQGTGVMRLSTYRLSDYRLAVYIVVAAVVGGVTAFTLDRATAPPAKIEANGTPPAASAVRQIPIAKTSAADLGDPDGKLTPVYPAAPGKDLPIKDTPVVQAVKPPAETSGSANASVPAAPSAPAPVAAATPAPPATSSPANACNVAACAAAYRSFRESDCSYQPFEGPRRYCEGAPGEKGQIASQSPAQVDTRSTVPAARSRYDDTLRDAERTVRRLPPPSERFGDDDEVVVIEAPQQRYDIRRNWIIEPQD
jgi:hypothetical protein